MSGESVALPADHLLPSLDHFSGTNELHDYCNALQAFINSVTTDCSSAQPDSPEIKASTEQCCQRFAEKSRKLEGFFASCCNRIGMQSPEIILQEEIADMEEEINRKSELITKHQARLLEYKALLEEEGPKGAGTSNATVGSTSAGQGQAKGSAHSTPSKGSASSRS